MIGVRQHRYQWGLTAGLLIAFGACDGSDDTEVGEDSGRRPDSGTFIDGGALTDSAVRSDARTGSGGDAGVLRNDAAQTGGQPAVFEPAAGCLMPPSNAAPDAALPSDAAVPVFDSGLDASSSGCVDCQPAYVQRVVGSGVFVTDTYPACCAAGDGGQTCGVNVDGTCYARDQAGVATGACPRRCCRLDGMCGARVTSLGLGCIAADESEAVTCRAAAAAYPGECACGSCAEEIGACAADADCTAIVECRAGRSDEHPAAGEGYALADALDRCLETAGCARLPAVGICRNPCPSGSAGSVIVQVDLVGCCRDDGLCGVVGPDDTCILYDDPPLNAAPRSLIGPSPTCRAVSLPHPDACACDSCEDALVECARDPGCTAISECRVETGCEGDSCESDDACGAVIDEHGGPEGDAADAARAVEACLVGADCEPRQFGFCR